MDLLKKETYEKIDIWYRLRWRDYIARWIISNIKPDNVYTSGLSNCYEVRENDKYFGIPYGYFWHAVAVGYLLKLIKFITKRTKE